MLAHIQSELKAPKNQYNSFGKYKYRTCEDILESVKPLLLKNKATLTISDEIKEIAGILFVEATVFYKSDSEEFVVKSQAGIEPNKKGMDISQSFGASSSYARKYALNGLFLIDDNKDADSSEPSKTSPTKKVVPNIKTVDPTTFNEVSKALADCDKDTYTALKTKYAKLISEFPSVKSLFQAKYQTL